MVRMKKIGNHTIVNIVPNNITTHIVDSRYPIDIPKINRKPIDFPVNSTLFAHLLNSLLVILINTSN